MRSPTHFAAGLLFFLSLSAVRSGTAQENAIAFEGHSNVVSCVRFAPNGRHLVSGSWDETVRIWDIAAPGAPVVLNGHTDWVECIALTRDGQRIVSASQRDVRVWNVSSKSEELVFTAPGQFSISAMALSEDGNWLAAGIRDGTVRVWKIGTDQPHLTLKTDSSWTRSLAFSADGNRLAAGNWLGTVRVWDLAGDGRELAALNAHPNAVVSALCFSPDGTQLATGGYDARITIWDTSTWSQKNELKGHKGLVLSLAYSPSSQLLASGERHGYVRFWTSVGEEVATREAHPDGKLGFSVVGLAFSPDGKRLASCSYDRTVKLWPVP